MAIRRLWLLPPLAIARLGPSAIPCDSFGWGPDDLRPSGTGKTTILPAETLRVAADGTVSSDVPQHVMFKDSAGWRPVCPFVELHGEWESDGTTRQGPITAEVLALFGLTIADLRWRVEVANLKSFHYTLADGDRVAAAVEVAGDVHAPTVLRATSPANTAQPLIPTGTTIPLGRVQVTRPSPAHPELRLRFTPAIGAVYGPTDLAQRSQSRKPPTARISLPADRRILNPNAAWCRFRVTTDGRTNPGGLFAKDDDESAPGEDDGVSLGLVDDVCDGLVHATLPGVPRASARVVVGPPDFAPDRRPFVSLADGLTDRVDRAAVSDPGYVENVDLTSLEVRDLFERILETVDNINIDVQNDRIRAENRNLAAFLGIPQATAVARAFPRVEPLAGRPLPLTQTGRQRHRRFLALEVLEDLLREQPDLVERVIRAPVESDPLYDRRMPAVMRGSDRRPMHLTRRQHNLLVAWVARLREDIEPGT
ncbi:MAG: hypothetical protein ACR2GH_06315 [Pseudonocardia sp.]